MALPVNLTRRAFGKGLSGITAALGIGATSARAGASVTAVADPFWHDAALRGLAHAGHRGDPVLAARAEAAFASLEHSDPASAALGRIYQLLDTRGSAWWDENAASPATPDLERLHNAINAARPVAFHYFDLAGEMTSRTVFPLALVHPPQGVKLLAWCAKRKDYRQFFVRAMQNLSEKSGSFSGERLMLLQGLLAREAGKVSGPRAFDDA